MKRTTLGSVVVLLVAAVALAAWRREPAHAQPPAAEERWQYATLAPGKDAGHWVWRGPDRDIAGDRPTIYRELGGRAKIDLDVFTLEVLNQIGQHGWDLVAVRGEEGAPEFWFKRPAR